MSREARVGIFVLLGVLILTYFTFRISKWGGIARGGYTITVDFDSAAGLEPKANVKMAGVPIGKVEDIKLVGTRARLVLRINEGIVIPIDSQAAIRTQGMLGEKYVDIVPGRKADQQIPAGGRIVQTVPPADLDEIMKKVSSIADDIKRLTTTLSDTLGTPEGKEQLAQILKNFQEATASLRNVVTGNEDRLNRILANIDRLSADLGDIASANKEDVRAVIANLRDFSQTLKEEAPDLARKLEMAGEGISQLVGDNRENIREGIANFRNASAKLDNTLDAASRVMSRIERGEGTLGKLVSDNTTITTLNSTLEGINRYVRKTETLKTYLDYRLEYQVEPSEFKHYVNLRLQPSADKYYLLGAVDDPRGKRDEDTSTITVEPPGTTTHTTRETFSNDLKFTALVAKRFSRLTMKGGVMESSGGVGLDYLMPGDRLTIGADIFDFGRKDQPAHLKVYGNYDIVKNLFITGGVDDILNDDNDFRTFFLGFGIKFLDEDIKTVIGAVPLRP